MWRVFLSVVLVALVSACGGPPAAIIGVDGRPPVAEVPGATAVDIFVATSRAEDPDPRILFSGERSRTLSFARVTVFVPPERTVGEVNRATSLPPDARRNFVVLDPVRFPDGRAFVRAVDAEIVEAAAPRPVLVFVHGFNTDLPSAIVRTAQFVHDSGFTGVPVLFSWPSRGRALSYVYDVNSVLQSRDALVETAQLLQTTRAKSFDILAHSLGNLLVVEALRQISLERLVDRKNRIDNVMLASPDVDVDLFESQLDTLPVGRDRIYVLVASSDRALALSRRIAGGVSRAGNADPDALAALGVTVVDVSAVRDGDALQHSQFASAPEIVQLIGAHMRRTGEFVTPEDASLRGALVNATLLPARIVGGGGRVVVVGE
jgi:esterase/lipase superfamily enzyme